MYPKVARWLVSLPLWKQKVFEVLNFFGQEELGYRIFGFYEWDKTHS
jgi:hypothetical protein